MTRIVWFTLGLVMAAATGAWAQGITTHPVRDNVYMLEGRGGNIGVSVGDDGILIIDDQYANMADAIREALEKLSDGDLKFILNTHFHGDHTGGNEALGQGVAIVGHTNVRKRLLKGKDLGNQQEREGLPVITFDETMSIHFNGDDLELVHFPTGHTDTDSVVFFKNANVVHMGDHFFVGRYPFIDLGGGGDVASYVKNVEKIIGMLDADVKIIPGHGPLADLDDLKAFHAMLVKATGIIREGIDAGKSRDDLIAEGMPAEFGEAGSGFINDKRWIGIVYDSFTR